jgi:hypothetical protein
MGFPWLPHRPKRVVTLEEFLMSQVAQQEAFARSFVEKGLFTDHHHHDDNPMAAVHSIIPLCKEIYMIR